MGEIINLRKARKARDRVVKAKEAEGSRARHGRTLAERESERAAAERAARLLDGARVSRAEPVAAEADKGNSSVLNPEEDRLPPHP